MSFYASPPAKFHGVHPAPDPASPMPSYLSASSQSASTSHGSPGGRSDSTSESYGGPPWITPGTPHSYDNNNNSAAAGSEVHSSSPQTPPSGGGMIVVSPTSSPGMSDFNDERGFNPAHDHHHQSQLQPQPQPYPNSAANARALALLDSTAGQDVRLRAMSAPHVVRKRDDHVSRKNYNASSQASQRALDLLNQTAAGTKEARAANTAAPSQQVFTYPKEEEERTDSDKNGSNKKKVVRVKDIKRTSDKIRERESNIRALALLDATVGQDVSEEARLASNPNPKGCVGKKASAEMVRQAKIKQYKEQKRRLAPQQKRQQTGPTPPPAPESSPTTDSSVGDSRLNSMKGASTRPNSVVDHNRPPKKESVGSSEPAPDTSHLKYKKGQEVLAESSRKPRDPHTMDDSRLNPETVAGMKDQLDIEREEWAKKRALKIIQKPGPYLV